MMGLGQLYVGRPGRALLFFLGLSALQFSLCVSVFLAPPFAKLGVFIPGFALLVGAHVLGMLDALTLARRLRSFDATRFNRVRFYLAYLVLGALLSISLIRVERQHLVDLYRVKSTSMSPALRNGDYLLVNRQIDCVDCASPLCAGDIVVFEDDASLLVKRAVGLPGDEIRIRDQVLSVNGQPATGSRVASLGDTALDHFHRASTAFAERLGGRDYVTLWGAPEEHSTETTRVPPDALFVLGDNRHHSKDSRQLGTVPLTSVRGRVEQIWFSGDRHSGIRPERMGASLSSSRCEDTTSTTQTIAAQSTRAPTPAPALAGGQADQPPNLLIITIDTLRADHVGAYGYAKAGTSTLDRIAEVSVRFENAVTPFPRTTPALASLFTGLWPHHHGSRDVGIPIKRGPTLAEVLKQQGYETHAVTSTALASRKQHFDRGFDDFDGRSHDTDHLLATDVTKRALEMVRGASRTRPQLLWVHYFDPHFPYGPPRGFADQPEAAACRQLIRNVLEHPKVEWNLHSNWGRVAERVRSDCIELYDAEIHYTDTEIARLLHGLNEFGYLKSVVIVITADHGESFGESGTYYEHGATVHDAVVRIPLTLAAPGVEARVEPMLFSLEDLMPTLLGLLEVEQDAWPVMDGRDYSARLRRPADLPLRSEGVVFAEGANANKPPLFVLPFDAAALRHACAPGQALGACRRFGGAGELLAAIMGVTGQSQELPEMPSVTGAVSAINTRFRNGDARQRSVRTREFKLVQAPRVDGGVQRALFDLVRDPGETTDVSARHPGIRAHLGTELDRWLAGLPKVDAEQLAPEDLEVLRRLGYIE